jgi:hypothetical protein
LSLGGNFGLHSKTILPQIKITTHPGWLPDRSIDIEFWQEQGDEAIFSVAWEMVVLTEEINMAESPDYKELLPLLTILRLST